VIKATASKKAANQTTSASTSTGTTTSPYGY
jgi:hypothetical protein